MNVIIIGGGIAGCEAAIRLANQGIKVVLIEKENVLGGKLNQWHVLFPDYKKAEKLKNELLKKIDNPNITIYLNSEIKEAAKSDDGFKVMLPDTTILKADKLLITTGYNLFEAQRKEEYGYGIYKNVITSADLEKAFSNNNLDKNIKRIAFIHCVGSRDEKVCNLYCSKLCCITAVKQAMEVRERLPDAEIICFYMDMRMFGSGYEEMYREAQENSDIKFIRGRLSEASENIDKQIVIKTEDTLMGKPLKMTIDLMVLMVGMEPNKRTKNIAQQLNINLSDSGFIKPLDAHFGNNLTNINGVFVAGCASAPMTITDTINDSRSAAASIIESEK